MSETKIETLSRERSADGIRHVDRRTHTYEHSHGVHVRHDGFEIELTVGVPNAPMLLSTIKLTAAEATHLAAVLLTMAAAGRR